MTGQSGLQLEQERELNQAVQRLKLCVVGLSSGREGLREDLCAICSVTSWEGCGGVVCGRV